MKNNKYLKTSIIASACAVVLVIPGVLLSLIPGYGDYVQVIAGIFMILMCIWALALFADIWNDLSQPGEQ
jgi:hypothetical protein